MANDLILTIINNNGVDVTDSRDVANMIGKKHYTLMRDIRSYIGNMKEDPNTDLYWANSQDLNNNIDKYFIESTYKDENDQDRKCFLVTQKGCEYIAHKMKGKKK